jgi:hypothetical protein
MIPSFVVWWCATIESNIAPKAQQCQHRRADGSAVNTSPRFGEVTPGRSWNRITEAFAADTQA